MKTIAFLLTLAALTLPAFAQSQVEMNAEAAAEFKAADAKLNTVYKELKNSQDEETAARLKTAQKAWLAYRDAQVELESASSKGGSIYPLVVMNVKTRLTGARTTELQEMLNGATEEGDVAASPDEEKPQDE